MSFFKRKKGIGLTALLLVSMVVFWWFSNPDKVLIDDQLVLEDIEKPEIHELSTATQTTTVSSSASNTLTNESGPSGAPDLEASFPVEEFASSRLDRQNKSSRNVNLPADNRTPDLDIVPNQVMMSFTDSFQNYSREEKDALLAPYGVAIIKEYPYAGNSVLLQIINASSSELGELPAGETKESIYLQVNKVIEDLQAADFVEYAQTDSIVRTQAVPNDARYSDLWGLDKIQTEQAWDHVEQNYPLAEDIIVGVIDTGIDYTHPDLANNIWVNSGEIANNGIDDDGNGYIDDIHGWDSHNDDGDPMDDDGHGTHVAGTIGAESNNTIGVVGVAPNIKMMALKFLNENGEGYTSDAIELLNYIHQMKQEFGVNIRLTNNSWGGGPYNKALEDAIAASENLNILFVAAAGNDGKNTDYHNDYPQGFDVENIISVASTDNLDKLSVFTDPLDSSIVGGSNYGGKTVDVAAPGSDILSTLPNNSYGSYSGTSMATPHVSGVLALLLSSMPELTTSEIKDRLYNGGDFVYGLSEKVRVATRLNAANTFLTPIFETDIEGDFISIEEDQTVTVKVRLRDEIQNTISASVFRAGGDTHILPVGQTTLTFNSTNWNEWQDINIQANGDIDNISGQTIIKIFANGYMPLSFLVVEQDEDPVSHRCNLVTQIPYSECVALAKVYESTNGHAWNNNTNWLNRRPCEWYGVECWNGHVVVLDLFNNSVSGTIPNEIDNLPYLEYLGFGLNRLSGSIPSEIGDLTKLYTLDLQYNNLTGSIPDELGNLSDLEYLLMGINQLSGEIPQTLANLTKLKWLWLENNQLSGSFPSFFSNYTTLQELDLDNNQLSGVVPNIFGSLSELTFLNFPNNKLSGEIPSSITSIQPNATVNLKYNSLDTSNQSVINFLNSRNSGWSQTQTLLPENISINFSNEQLKLQWNPIEYTDDIGGYIISYSSSANGPFIEHGQTANKASSEYIVADALNNPDRYFVVQAFTAPHGPNQQNNLITEYSQSVSYDHGPPIVTAPDDLLVVATSEFMHVDLGVATATDFFEGEITPVTADSTGPFSVGVHTITWSATDSNGNRGTDTQQLTIQGLSGPPLVTAPADVVIEATGAMTPVDLGTANATDADGISLNTEASSLGPFSVGLHNITWSATDRLGNTSTATQLVTVQDTTAPSLTVPADITLEATAELTPANLGSATAIDSVSGAITPTADQSGPFAIGHHVVTWTATDGAGNIETATQTITIQDTTSPVIMVEDVVKYSPGGDALSHLLQYPVVNDVSPVTLTHNLGSDLTYLPLGVTTVVWTAVDVWGNQSIAQQNIEYIQLEAANLLTPTEGTLLDGEVTFTWDTVPGAEYSLEIGTDQSTDNIFSQHLGTSTSVTVSGLPDDVALFVRLNTHMKPWGLRWDARHRYQEYVFNTVNPAMAYYPNHSGLMACEKMGANYTFNRADDESDLVWVLNPDNDAVSLLSVTRDPQTYALSVDAQNDYFWYTNSHPSSISRVGNYVAVTYADSGYIRFNHIDWFSTGTVPWTTWHLIVEEGERPVASVAHENFLYVALAGSGEVIKIDIEQRAIIARLPVGPSPQAMALTSDGSRLLVTRYQTEGSYGEVYDINTSDLSFRDPIQPSIWINPVWMADANDNGLGVPNHLRGVVIDKDNRYAYITAEGSNDNGVTSRSIISVIDLHTHQDLNGDDGATPDGTIELPNTINPSGISFLPDGVTRIHAESGNNRVELINTTDNSSMTIDVGELPQSFCHTANTLYVKNHGSRTVTIIDTAAYLSRGDTSFLKQLEVETVPFEEDVAINP